MQLVWTDHFTHIQKIIYTWIMVSSRTLSLCPSLREQLFINQLLFPNNDSVRITNWTQLTIYNHLWPSTREKSWFLEYTNVRIYTAHRQTMCKGHWFGSVFSSPTDTGPITLFPSSVRSLVVFLVWNLHAVL